MSSDAHAHGSHGGDHVPHVLPLIDYFKTYGALLVLTVVTVGASYVNLGHTLNLIIALGIATIKASVVAAIFMHLFWDQKFFAVIFSSTILFLAIFMAFTMFDTEARGVADPLEATKPSNWKQPFAGTVDDEFIKKSVEADKKFAAEQAGAYNSGLIVPTVPATPPAPAGAAPTPGAAPAPNQPAPTGAAPENQPAPGGAPPTAPAQPEGKEAPPAPAGEAPKAPPK